MSDVLTLLSFFGNVWAMLPAPVVVFGLTIATLSFFLIFIRHFRS